jgi:hypothetical protein
MEMTCTPVSSQAYVRIGIPLGSRIIRWHLSTSSRQDVLLEP